MKVLFGLALLLHLLGFLGIGIGAVGYGLATTLRIRRSPSVTAKVLQATAFVPSMKPILMWSTIALVVSGGAMIAIKPGQLLGSGFVWVGLVATIALSVNGAVMLEPWLMRLHDYVREAEYEPTSAYVASLVNDPTRLFNICCATGALAGVLAMMTFHLGLLGSLTALGIGLVAGFVGGVVLHHRTSWTRLEDHLSREV